ncbi:NUDIX hydrolase [Streptomyces albidoflavus]|nr:NUDIX hydrolase [Streptomyces albidoflavus]
MEQAQHGYNYAGQADDTRVAAAAVYARLAAATQTAEQAEAEREAQADADPEPEAIRLTTDVVVTTTDGQVLLIERGWDPHKGSWALPGGHVDQGETSRAAAVRELAEEAGVYAHEEELVQLGVWDRPDRDPRGRYVTVAYHLTVLPGTAIEPGDDATRAEWWPLADLPQLAFDHAEIIAGLGGPEV